LIYEQDCDVLSLGEIIKCLFNCLRVRFCNKYMHLKEERVCVSSEGGAILASTMRKFFFWSWVICPIPANSSPVTES